jgi:hypothetical protein
MEIRNMSKQSGEVVRLDNSMPLDKWVKRINAAWREQIPSIFETGNLLEAARLELRETHGSWTAMFQNGHMPFDKSTANKLIAVANNDNIRNEAHVPRLPVAWGTLYDLTKLTDEQFDNGIKSGAINPSMQRKDVKALRGIEPKEEKKKEEKKSGPLSFNKLIGTLKTAMIEGLKRVPPEEYDDFFLFMDQQIDEVKLNFKKKDVA